jgi:hypothetical protein
MSWRVRGVVIPGPPPVRWAVSHTALPVPSFDGDRCRLYFSSRDQRGRARIGSADLRVELDKMTVEQYRADPILSIGEVGAFDDHGVTSSCVVEHGGRIHLYYSGWSLGETVPFYFFVGLAVSDDGTSFHRISRAPVLERNEIDPFLTASPWVLVEDGLWRMWYVSGTGWTLDDGRPRHCYHVKYAESDDGIAWRREGVVAVDYRDESEYAISRPCVVRDADRYRMWFAARGDRYRIEYAESSDGIVWERTDAGQAFDASPGDWDSEMQAYPAVADVDGRRIVLYNGDGYGATGIGWAELESGG